MTIRPFVITAIAAAGVVLFAPANASAKTLAPAVIELGYQDSAALSADLYTDVRYHSRRGFHRGGYYGRHGFHRSHRFHRGYYGKRGFHHRSFRHHGIHDRRFRHHGVHKSKQFRNKHGVVIKKRH